MNKRNFLYRLVCETEDRFEHICYTYREITGDNEHWNVCVEDYALYCSESFKGWENEWYEKAKKAGVNIVFCCCVPSIEKLAKYAEGDNLIMRV